MDFINLSNYKNAVLNCRNLPRKILEGNKERPDDNSTAEKRYQRSQLTVSASGHLNLSEPVVNGSVEALWLTFGV